MTPRLQLALDTLSLTDAVQVAEQLRGYWDILEVGTPLLLAEGLQSVRVFRKQFPDATIMADTKIIDSGGLLAEAACTAGADLVTVVSAASSNTIRAAVKAAHHRGGQVLLDHIAEDWSSPVLNAMMSLGPDLIGFHLPKDDQSGQRLPVEALRPLLQGIGLPVSVAGGINPGLVEDLSGLKIDVLVVGSYLLNADDPIQNAKCLISKLARV